MTIPGLTDAYPAPAIARARAIRIQRGLVAPFRGFGWLTVVGFATAAGLALIVGVATHQPVLAAAVGFVLSLGVAIVAWLPFADPAFRAAVELFYDHDCHEGAEWKAETGTARPRGIRAAERWLAAYPDKPGRASLLLTLGRVEEADRAIEATRPRTPEEAFSVEILRQTRALYLGEAPDLAPLQAGWRSLPDPRERRHRRECLALLEAQMAVDTKQSPIDALAAGRREIGEVYWSMRTPWLMMKWFSFAILLVLSAALIVFALSV